MEIAILGPLEVRRDGVTADLGARKLRTLLIRLVLDLGRCVPADQLIDDLWDGDPPPGALTSLRSYVSNLRRALTALDAGDALVTRAGGYGLELDHAAVDATRFERTLEDGRRLRGEGDPSAALIRLDEGLRLWRGAALADVAGAGFARPTAVRLEELHRAAEEERCAALLGLGRADEAIADLERVILQDPLRERPHRLLTLALYRSGRVADALTVHRSFRERLADELGLDPGPRFERLVERILRRDPTLDLVGVTGPVDTGPVGTSAVRPAEDAPSARPTGGDAPTSTTGAVSDVVGREREGRQLDAAVARLMTGAGGLLLLGGEPGIGKTTLLDELARRAGTVAAVHHGRCPETPGAPPFWPWTCAVRSIVAQGDDPAVVAAARAAPRVLQLVPELADRIGVPVPPVGTDLPAARFALFEATARFLDAAAAARPIVMLLDDLHWADGPSLELLSFLGAGLTSRGLLIAASYRDVPADRTADLDATLASLARQAGVVELQLEGLDLDAITELATTQLGAAVHPGLLSAVHERTGGNPFFVGQLLQLIDDATVDPEAIPIPSGVRHVIARRLQLLAPTAQRVLEVGAVTGRQLDPALVAAAADLPVGDVLDALDQAHAHGLVQPTGSGTRHRFAHALIRETLYDGLSPATTVRLHAAVGAALGGSRSGGADELAEHLWRAGDLAPAEDVLSATVAAADAAVGVLAHERAEVLLRRALVLLDGRRDLDAEVAVRTRLVSLLTSVSGWAAPEVAEIAGRVRELSDEVGLRPDLLPLWHLLWTCVTTRGELEAGRDVAVELRDRALQAGDELHLATAELMRAYADAQRGDDGADALRRVVAARRALDQQPDAYLDATPEHLGVTALLAEACTRALVGDPDTLACCEELHRRAERVGRPFSLGAAELFAGWAAAVVGDHGSAMRWTDAALERCDRNGFRELRLLLTPVNAWAKVRAGHDPQHQADRIAAALDDLSAVGHEHVRAQWLALHADVLLAAGRPDDAAAQLEQARVTVLRTGEHVYEPQLAALDRRLAHVPGAGSRPGRPAGGRPAEVTGQATPA